MTFCLLVPQAPHQQGIRLATDTFCSLGVPVASHKTEGPSSYIIFLGIVVDTSLCQLCLPEEKLQRLQVMMSEWQARKKCTCKELERLLGHLSYASRVIWPGRVFLCEFFTLFLWPLNPIITCNLTAGIVQTWHGGSTSSKGGTAPCSRWPLLLYMCTLTLQAALVVEHLVS